LYYFYFFIIIKKEEQRFYEVSKLIKQFEDILIDNKLIHYNLNTTLSLLLLLLLLSLLLFKGKFLKKSDTRKQ
jgi:hypothetical protein